MGRPRERRVRAAAEPRSRSRPATSIGAHGRRPAARCSSCAKSVDTEQRARQRALDRSGCVRPAARAAAPARRRDPPAPIGPVHALRARSADAARRRSAGAAAARGVRRSVAGRRSRSGARADGASFERVGARARARDHRRDARRSAARADEPLRPRARACACSFTAARSRRSPTARCSRGANAAAVQRADGAWEVLQFANAELVGERTYELSRLLRGQAGSEWAMARSAAGGRAVRAARRARRCRSRAGSMRSGGRMQLARRRGRPRPRRSGRGRARPRRRRRPRCGRLRRCICARGATAAASRFSWIRRTRRRRRLLGRDRGAARRGRARPTSSTFSTARPWCARCRCRAIGALRGGRRDRRLRRGADEPHRARRPTLRHRRPRLRDRSVIEAVIEIRSRRSCRFFPSPRVAGRGCPSDSEGR